MELDVNPVCGLHIIDMFSEFDDELNAVFLPSRSSEPVSTARAFRQK